MRLLNIFFLASLVFPDSCNMELIGSLEFDQGLSDITGFYQDGREFAVVGLIGEDAAAFVDITDPDSPFEVGRIGGTHSPWRDLKYWNRHVYIGTEAEDGVKVISVDDPDNPILLTTITDFTSSHNIHIDKDGYLYVVGAAEHDIWIYDLSTPSEPDSVGAWEGEYLHDIEVYNNKIYGAGIYTGNFYIIDVSNKTDPTTLVSYHTGGGYISTHDCAVTEDEHYLITADETFGGHIKVWDISDYSNINLVSEYMTHPEHSIHNIYIRPGTNLVIMSYYVDGTRVLDISDPDSTVEVGYYDTTDSTGLYDGNWGTYAYLPSGYIISSDRQNGLFIFNSPLSNSTLEWNACPDCAGVPNGDAFEDCAGVCGGSAVVDECGICNGIGGTVECSDGTLKCYQIDCPPLSIENKHIPDKFAIQKIKPNPFNPVTQIEYSLPYALDVSLTVYGLLGRQVEILHNGIQQPGYHSLSWDASKHSSGMYFIRMVSGQYVQTQKIMLIK